MMPPAPQNTPPEVSTEAQRKALDEMSANLVLKLHQMIFEQEQRVQQFAADHATPISAPLREKALPPTPAPEYPQPPPLVTRKPPRPIVESKSGQLAQAEQEAEQDAAPESHQDPQQEGIGMGPIIFIIIAIVIMLRACS